MAAEGHLNDAGTFALWRCDEASGNLVDTTLGGRNLTAISTPGAGAGIVGGGRVFTAQTQRFERATDSAFSAAVTTGSFTFETWFNAGGVLNAGLNYICGAGSGVFFIGFNDARRVWSTIGGNIAVTSAIDVYPITGWQHVVGRVAASGADRTVTLFLNGVQVANALTTPATFGTPVLHVGAFSSAAGTAVGTVDDVRFSNIARTDAQILNSYQRGMGTAPVVASTNRQALTRPLASKLVRT